MNDGKQPIFEEFMALRERTLWRRFPGRYRAMVVETNDPLNMRRVRFRCPDLHDQDVKAENCQWALPAFAAGGPRCGSFTSPCIGDYIWIEFEREHPYGPVWTGFAPPSRRAWYPIPSVYTSSPQAISDLGPNGSQQYTLTAVNDYDLNYTPDDDRPMSSGFQDRYGNLDIFSAVGFFPTTHNGQEAAVGTDPLTQQTYTDVLGTPLDNVPDSKYTARVSKYGHIFMQCDQGYDWSNEFAGDYTKDDPFEIARWKYLQRLLTEDHHSSYDARKAQIISRYGSFFEIRDTGWAQPGPMSSKSRPGEYGTGDPVFLSTEENLDLRWVKLRSKAGHIRQQIDIGADPDKNVDIQRLLINEVGPKADGEDQYWQGRDGRQIRDVSAHGFKAVIFDAGSDPIDPRGKETPRGTGILLKGRRSGGQNNTGDQRGFFWQFDERETHNATTWGSPLGLAHEMNDLEQYIGIAARVSKFSEPWANVKDNEFLTTSLSSKQPWSNCHCLWIDLNNEFVSLKTRGGKGDGPFVAASGSVLVPVGAQGQQGLEMRDGKTGDGPWVEILEGDGRGLWFSHNQNLGVWRAKNGSDMAIWLDDGSGAICVRNAVGRIQVVCAGNVDVIGQTVNISGTNVNIAAQNSVTIQGGAAALSIGPASIQTNGAALYADTVFGFFPLCFPGGGAGQQAGGQFTVTPPTPLQKPAKIQPSDRGQRS